MNRIPVVMFCCAVAMTAATAQAQVARVAPQSAPAAAAPPSYATMTSQILGAPLVIDVRIRSASRVKDAEAAGLVPGRVRYYIVADVLALIRGTSAMPARIAYLADVPLDWRGRAPKLRKMRVLLFARPIMQQPGQVQLTGLDGQREWQPALDAQVRGIVSETLAADAPPAITGVGNAFHVPGSLPGEGETQIFLSTAAGLPVSLQVLRRPGERPRWSVSTGDIVDESAGAPPKDTLLWYRLACGLPEQLPESALASEEPANARVAREDYMLIRRELGPCA